MNSPEAVTTTAVAPPELMSRLHRTKMTVDGIGGLQPSHEQDPLILHADEWSMAIAGLKTASGSFVSRVVDQTPSAAARLYGGADLGYSHFIKAALTHRDLGRKKTAIIADDAAMSMVDRALGSENPEIPMYCTGFPMKVYNPLETHYGGDEIDLGDVSVLLRFAELAKALNHFGKDNHKEFVVKIVSDGIMNNGMFMADADVCRSYVRKLQALSEQLGIAELVHVVEFFGLLDENAPIKSAYEAQVAETKAKFHHQFDGLLGTDHLKKSIAAAVECEKQLNGTTAFEDIFNSTVGSTRYRGIEQLTADFGLFLPEVYAMILESVLWERDVKTTRVYAEAAQTVPPESMRAFDAALHEAIDSTLKQAWRGTVDYLAVMHTSSQLNVLDQLHPNGIRLTTRPKTGQIGVHTSDQTNPSLFSYHSVPVVRPTNRGRNVKIDFELLVNAVRKSCRAVQSEDGNVLFYLHPEIDILQHDITKLPWLRGSK